MGSLFSFLSMSHYVPKLHYGSSAVTISARAAATPKTIEKVPLSVFVQLRIPSLFQPFRPAWWLNRHVCPGSEVAWLSLTPRI